MNYISIYTSVYNLNKMGFSWKETIKNWTTFLQGSGQISIAVGTSEDDTWSSLSSYIEELKLIEDNKTEYTIFQTSVDFNDPLFDGKIKNEALKRCSREFCTLLDIDEVLPLHSRNSWIQTINVLRQLRYNAVFIPVIDLFHDEQHYKSLGQKWYLHRNLSNIKRGRVQFAAREDGTTDISKSDTCELIYNDGSLVDTVSFPGGPILSKMALNQIPYVVHLGWLNKQQRLRQSAFWAPVWSARDGRKTENPITNEELNKIPYYPHNLPHWNQE